jgi:micrococcal nuclease
MRLLLTFLMTMATLSFAEEGCKHDKTNFKCVQYVKNYDADTITFNIPNTHPLFGEKINIRVLGVDTPEIKTKNKCEKQKAILAKKEVETLLKNAKRIDLRNLKRGKYFRVVADVMVDGKSLTEFLLKNGHAYSYDGGKKKKMDWCKSSRKIASENSFKTTLY